MAYVQRAAEQTQDLRAQPLCPDAHRLIRLWRAFGLDTGLDDLFDELIHL